MKIAGIIVGALVLVIAVLGLVAPTTMHVERTVVIEKPKEAVFADLKMLKHQNEWSVWAKRDPNIKMDYKGEDGTVGFVSAWSGNNDVGVGEQEIKAITEGSRIDYELRFKEPFQDTAQSSITTDAVSDHQTKVTWTMDGKRKFPVNVICLVVNADKMIVDDFDKGLAALKTRIESQPAAAAAAP